MAAGTILHRFEIELADTDRSVYESLDLRVARHPSESASFLLVRVLAYCLEYTEGIAFSKGGVSSTDEPALSVQDASGERSAWIEVGAPSAERLHRASKATPRVALYTDRRPDVLRRSLAGERIHRADAISLTAFPRSFLTALEPTLDRRVRWHVSLHDGHLHVTSGDLSVDLALEPRPLLEP